MITWEVFRTIPFFIAVECFKLFELRTNKTRSLPDSLLYQAFALKKAHSFLSPFQSFYPPTRQSTVSIQACY
uniref:Uncharacterized protein n=1 Tax=Salix viminalis TaxID=40686 RepID=A0A6N2M506_SALVM